MATQIYLGMPPPKIKEWIEKNYKPVVDMTKVPLHFTANEDGSSVSLVCFDWTANDWDGGFIDSWCEFEYSMTGKDDDWSEYATEQVVPLNEGETVYFRAKQGNVEGNPNLNGLGVDDFKYHYFIMKGSIKVDGNIQFLRENTGTKMDVPKYCYYGMFNGCKSLTQAPVLPATTLAKYCYSDMFQNCTSLTQAPELPATTLADDCYRNMFNGCTSLTQAPELPATTLAHECYMSMFSGCTSLTQAPELPATTLDYGCYAWMFSYCSSLTQAPELPAETLVNNCYSNMFQSCTSLNNVNVSFSAWNTNGTYSWLDSVAAEGTFTCPTALPDNPGEHGIPSGWTRINK